MTPYQNFDCLVDELWSVLSYDPSSGVFKWKVHRGRNKLAGLVAGSVGSHGYVQIHVNRRLVLAHRLAWAMHHREDPGELQIDHINRIRIDNRIDNLRLVDRSTNQRNRDPKGCGLPHTPRLRASTTI